MMANFQQEAMNKLGLTAPEVVSLVVSFRDLSDEIPEGSDTSVGVFILRAGAGVFFIPVVAKGNTIYPIDSVYDNQDQHFKPLTKTTIEQVLSSQSIGMGSTAVLPKYVNANPSIYNMIVPPRTGKYVYASQGLFTEFVASLPNHLKDKFKTGIMEDVGLAKKLQGMLNMAEVIESLEHTPSVQPTINASTPDLRIYTAADAGKNGLADAVVQDILNVGYHIDGDNVTPRVAVEAPRGAEGFSQFRGVEEGRAYEFILRDGSCVKAMVPKRLKAQAAADLPSGDSSVSVGVAVSNRPAKMACGLVAITEYGDWITDSNAVVRPNPVDISEVASELYALAKIGTIVDVERGDKFLVVTPKGVVGPLTADNVSLMSSMSIIQASDLRGCRYTITASSAFKGDVFQEGSNLYLPSHATVIELGHGIDLDVEISISSAVAREELKNLGLLQSQMVIRGHDNGFFSINGRSVGDEAELVKILMIGEGIGKQACLGFVKSAKEKKSVVVYLSKSASDMDAIAPGDIPEYGQAAIPDSGDLFDRGAIQQSVQTLDPGVVEATLISQFLQDPSMSETIASYIPVIKESIDKIGRSLLLLRINSEASMPEDIAALITSLRNTYRMLGDNCAKLEYLVNGSQQ